MGRTAIVLMLASLVVASAISGMTPMDDGTAKIRLLDPTPVTLRGLGFQPLERVRLTVRLGEVRAKRAVRATRAGRFTTRFPALRYGRCSGELAVTAVGRLGSHVSWELVPLECPNQGDT
jgi:hypothetical protein